MSWRIERAALAFNSRFWREFLSEVLQLQGKFQRQHPRAPEPDHLGLCVEQTWSAFQDSAEVIRNWNDVCIKADKLVGGKYLAVKILLQVAGPVQDEILLRVNSLRFKGSWFFACCGRCLLSMSMCRKMFQQKFRFSMHLDLSVAG